MNVDIQNALCRNFCQYYKPSKNEELACKGFLVVERFIEKGWKIPLGKPQRKPGEATEAILVFTMCARCPFYKDDCDFVAAYRKVRDTGNISSGGNTPAASPAESRGLMDTGEWSKSYSPCGGFKLLGHLLESGIVSIDDIRDMV